MPIPIHHESSRAFSKMELKAKEAVAGFITGMHKSPFHGYSVEFAEHRQYMNGESTRHVDWKLYGRTDKMYVKKYEEETNLRAHIVLDHSSSMYYPKGENNKINFAVHGAAALTYLMASQRDAIGLSAIHENIDVNIPAKGSKRHQRLLFHTLEEILNKPSESKQTFLGAQLKQLAELYPKRSMIFIFTDLLESADDLSDFYQGLQYLKYKKHEVVVFHVLDHQTELHFELPKKALRLKDLESGTEMKIMPEDFKKMYTEAMQDYILSIKTELLKYKVDYVPADIRMGYDAILKAYLQSRKNI